MSSKTVQALMFSFSLLTLREELLSQKYNKDCKECITADQYPRRRTHAIQDQHLESVLVQIPMVETLQRMSTVELLSRPEQLPRLPTLWPVGSLAFRS
jgi:hypothetical protein